MSSLPAQLRSFICVLLVVTAGCDRADSDRCESNVECPDGESCFRLPTGSQLCLSACDAHATVLCEGGRLCAAVPAEDAIADVCLPGGATAVGSACATSADCVIGAICVTSAGQIEARCRRACPVGTPGACPEGQACAPIDAVANATRGTCETPPSAP